MTTFLHRRASAATEAMLFAILVTMFGALTLTQSSIGGSGGGQTLVGVLYVDEATDRGDGSHWQATVDVGGRIVAIKISHEDAHRAELTGSVVRITGSWATDGSFVASAVGLADGDQDDDLLLAAAIGRPDPSQSSNRADMGAGRTTVTGVLSFAHGDDLERGVRGKTDYFVTDRNGRATEVAFAREPSSRLPGTQVRLSGRMKSGTFVPDGGSAEIVGSAAVNTTSTGTHRVAIVLFNFSNNATEPYTPAIAEGVAFTNADSVAAYYAESSWGQLTLSGDVFGWYTIPDSSGTSCNYSGWSNSANQAASAAGVDLTSYDNVVYAFPTSTACGWAGLANMPGRNSWLNGPGAMNLRTMAHELGHNFGTHHASSLNCTEGGVPVSLASAASCALGEYGDPYSIMGGASRYHPTTFSRGNFGWLLDENSHAVSSSGDYTLAPAPVFGSSVTTLRIPRTASSWLALEYRQPYGTEFERFAATSPAATGVTVRITAAVASRTQSQLVDTNPATTSFIDAPLAVGMTLIDPVSGTSISTVSVSPDGAVVRISLGELAPQPTASPTTPPTPPPTPEPTIEPTPEPTIEPTPAPTATPTATPTTTPAPTIPVDAEPPTAPQNLRIVISRSGKVSVAWAASSDNVNVAGYLVYRDGILVAGVKSTKWNDGMMLRSGTRTYAVVARDAAGNLSPPATVVATR